MNSVGFRARLVVGASALCACVAVSAVLLQTSKVSTRHDRRPPEQHGFTTVYSPDGGFVVSGGLIDSPLQYPSLAEKARWALRCLGRGDLFGVYNSLTAEPSILLLLDEDEEKSLQVGHLLRTPSVVTE